MGIHLSQGRVFVSLKTNESANAHVLKKTGIRTSVLVKRDEHGDTLVFGDHLVTAPGINETLCHPYSFASSLQACPRYTERELLSLFFHFVALEVGHEAADFAVVVPRELSQEEKETFAVALAAGFKRPPAEIRVHFMTESTANLAYLAHEDKAKRPRAGDRIVALYYGSSHSQVVAYEHSETDAPVVIYHGGVEAGSTTFEDCIERELNVRTGVPEDCGRYCAERA